MTKCSQRFRDMDRKTEIDMVEKVVNELGEHFDSVQILVSRYASGDEDGTVNISMGIGNWYARYGHVKEWCVKCDERTRKMIREED